MDTVADISELTAIDNQVIQKLMEDQLQINLEKVLRKDLGNS